MQPPKPLLKKLGRLPLPAMLTLDCGTTLDKIKGDPGSVVLALCPKACAENGANVTGVGIFSSGSSICKAAILSNVIFDDLGGIVQVTNTMPIFKAYKTENANIKSEENNTEIGALLRTFHVSRPNSCTG